MDYIYYQLEEQEGCFRGDKYEEVLEDALKDFAELLHAREWYLSGDTGEGSWNEARDSFVAKYFSLQPQNYCQDCRYWHNEVGRSYGKCDFITQCLMHRFDPVCERFSRKEKE